MLDIAKKLDRLADIYESYAEQVHVFLQVAACKAGCAYCCTHYGNLDITTLEGLSIRHHVETLPRPLQIRIRKSAERNKKRKEKRLPSDCPFLTPEKTCMVYETRPLSCRQLYSVKVCGKAGPGPVIHRQAVTVTRQYVQKMQQLDATGYSGHLTYILHLLDRRDFQSIYLSGAYDPQRIAAFGKSHGILINRVVSQNETGTNFHHPRASQRIENGAETCYTAFQK